MSFTEGSRTSRVLFAACVCALAALALMTWQLFDPYPLQVLVALSVGQLLGTTSFVAFIYIVARDLRPARKAAREILERSGEETP